MLVAFVDWECVHCGNAIELAAGIGGGICRICHRVVCRECADVSGPLWSPTVRCHSCATPTEVSPAAEPEGDGAEAAPAEVRR